MLLVRGADPAMRDDGQRLAADFATQGSHLEKLLRLPKGSEDAGEVLQAALQDSQDERLLALKEEGNAAFKKKKYEAALLNYRQALVIVASGQVVDRSV